MYWLLFPKPALREKKSQKLVQLWFAKRLVMEGLEPILRKHRKMISNAQTSMLICK